ncbi:hypothetical protein LDP08_02485 [Ralstonia pseudosolanacearum]|uniref:hypothetical protein n=1 Tax=Ralstonia pseudosolanacearum TaxID=1310165 RepID=UPI003CE796A3
MKNDSETLNAVMGKLGDLRKAYPERRVLVVGEDIAAVVKRCEVGKRGVEMTVSSLDDDSNEVVILWTPSQYALMMEEEEVKAATEREAA